MSKRTCSVDGCEKPHKAKGYCGTHYARLRSVGEVGGIENQRAPKPLPTCTVPDCGSDARSSGALYCEMHYMRFYRTGRLDAARRKYSSGNACSADGCDTIETDRDMCAMHARRVRRHGDPTVCIAPEDRNVHFGPDNHSWTGDHATYEAAHLRVKAARGRASDHLCVDCGDPARQWSYDHADPGERIGGRGSYPYSLDPDHYVPRCVPCHKKLDLSVKRGAA